MFYLRYASVDLKPNITSAPHNDWLYLIHASNCQKNFPNIYQIYGVTVQSKSCFIVLHSIFIVQVFVKVMDSVISNCKSDKNGAPVIRAQIVSTHNFRLQ